METLHIEPGTTKIEECEYLFANYKTVIIPDTVIEIGNGAFCKCIELETVIIPDSVRIIGKRSFLGCTKLKK